MAPRAFSFAASECRLRAKPELGLAGDLAALLDVGQCYTPIPLCNILNLRSLSHRIFIPQNQ